MDLGAPPCMYRDDLGRNAAHLAVGADRADLLLALIKGGKTDPPRQGGATMNQLYQQDKMGRTLLHLAATHNSLGCLELLLSRKGRTNRFKRPIDVNRFDNFQETPLHYAARTGHAAVSGLLLESGADITAKRLLDGATPLHVACASGHHMIVAQLLEAGSDIEGPDDSEHEDPPLHVAARHGSFMAVLELLKRDAEPRSRNKNGFTAQVVAADRGYIDCAELLRDAGTGMGIDDWVAYPPPLVKKMRKKIKKKMKSLKGAVLAAKSTAEPGSFMGAVLATAAEPTATRSKRDLRSEMASSGLFDGKFEDEVRNKLADELLENAKRREEERKAAGLLIPESVTETELTEAETATMDGSQSATTRTLYTAASASEAGGTARKGTARGGAMALLASATARSAAGSTATGGAAASKAAAK